MEKDEISTIVNHIENGDDLDLLSSNDQDIPVRERLNASGSHDRMTRPQTTASGATSENEEQSNVEIFDRSSSIEKHVQNDADITQNADASVDTVPPNHLEIVLTSTSDDTEIVIEDNELIIQESPAPKFADVSISVKDFGPGLHPPDGDISDAGSEEPEPGATVGALPQEASSLDLLLVTPGDSQSGSDDDNNDTSGNVSAENDLNESEEYSPAWFCEKKHVFIFSEAGKPIFSRYGKEENIVGLFGVMQALLSCVIDQKDELHCMRTCDHLFVFRCHHPLVLVAISHLEDSEDQLSRQLKYVANQAIFFLTQTHMVRLFKNRHNYDLRRQLTGLPKFFNGIIRFTEEEISFLLSSIRCLPMPYLLRCEITNILLTNRCPELVFAIVLFESQVISIVRPKQYAISPHDLHLLMNYVRTGSTRGHGEKWAPCCLPDFNDGGYLYIHDSYISDTSNISLVLITNEREQHLTMIKCKQQIVEEMVSQKTIEKLETLLKRPFVSSETKIPHLYHFIYKSKSSRQLVIPEFSPPYNSDTERIRLHAQYCDIYDKLHKGDRKLTIYYTVGQCESVIGYSMSNSEIYCTFSPHVTRPVALNNVDKLLRWIRREENRFFILGTGVY